MLVIPTQSEKTTLEYTLGVVAPNDQKLKLFVNDVVPDDTFVAANLTEMSTLSYADKTLTKANWVVTAGAAGAPASGAYAQQQWILTAGAAVTVYGYYVVDSVTGKLLWAERFNNPKTVGNAGDQVLITPTLTNSRT